MPNWCRNTLIIANGDPKLVFDAIRTESSLFDFNTLMPMPIEIDNAPVDSTTRVPEWYRWLVQNWGTKWNSANAEYSVKSPHNTLHFDTAWKPPVPVFEALAERFPNHEFTIYSDEWINHFHYTFLIKGGRLLAKTETCSCFEQDSNAVLTPEASQDLLAEFGAKEVIE